MSTVDKPTKTISLEEAYRQATARPATYSPHYKDGPEGHLFFINAEGACTIGLTGAASMPQTELDTTAALLKHSFNVLPEAVEVLKEALSMYEVQLQLESATDPTCIKMRAIIAKSSTVEVPA